MGARKARWRWRLLALGIAYVVVAWIYAADALSGTVRSPEILPIEDVAEEPVTLMSGDIELVASFYAHPSGAPCAVVMLHGLNSSRSSVLTFAPLYWELGCSLFAFDHRDHGRSSPAHRTYGFLEADDTVHAINWVTDRMLLSPDQVGLHGVSFGAATALEVLDRRDDLAFVVADSPYSSMEDFLAYGAADTLTIFEPLVRPLAFLIFELRSEVDVGQVSAVETVVRKTTPILLLHTFEDDVVPVDHSAKIALANPGIERHVLEADGTHLGAYFLRPAAYRDLVHDFLARRAHRFSR